MHEWLLTMDLAEAWIWYERGLLTAQEIVAHYGRSEEVAIVVGFDLDELDMTQDTCKHEDGRVAH